MSTLEVLRSQPPSCFDGFQLEVDEALINGEFSICKSVVCTCGGQNHSILGNIQIEKKGFFFKKEVTSFYPPFYLQCESCGSKELLFNPNIHGWDGVNGDSATIVGTESVTSLGLMGKVVIAFSYQGIDNYLDIPIDTARNMFDTFSLGIMVNGQLQYVYDCECA
ncbi:hypothetical protein J7384_10785 [Endozoicomonas sp. G2_1]|uniref:hypothetical protein n=1 Tax=Endozoicomonas sp. G2_1 TaxID=2821091 RepID=UPI001ADA5567|nr:hypothetical protein [Endozoicomonas sp. G2_1]MBO9490842.1 hypothetical protein [Endozoicomonas sp. G2_1]